ncbi:MAG: hypothetical protein FJZ11_01210 [Candidatus Omnitrophica bacterium]|nr:hypothetical protein [Candidatus Omnitrophota bacterium]
MDFFALFKTISFAMLEIFILAAFGFILVRKKIISDDGIRLLSKLLVEFILPLFIFTKVIKSFSFSLYPNWWIFPIISIMINLAGFSVGFAWFSLVKQAKTKLQKRQLVSLVGFQNSGYLPLILVATLLSSVVAETMFIYIFLFLLGFNLLIWSFGVWFLSGHSVKRFEFASVFSPPVVAIAVSLIVVALGIDKLIPQFLFHPAKMLGDCLLPLSMIVVGANLAEVSVKNINRSAITNAVILKLILLPILALAVLWWLRPEYLIGLLIILQAAVPSATTLSLITRHYRLEDEFVSHGIFFTHLVCVFTIPAWLVVYQIFAFFK